jgi:hypothetical protein
LQFDLMENFDGTIAAATHGEMAQSRTSAHALFEFLTTKWEDGRAVIEDPYAATGLAHGTAP